ncbi:unnamed protein product [Pleuronectes platessa]|uniref:Uncharacterized protein n=1 Tax=Pleuronectes platessa TaxID=8262 RepID=A0A9N7V341_PLEPL|nr:unnamed protein product [Pleuronectes platessa]
MWSRAEATTSVLLLTTTTDRRRERAQPRELTRASGSSSSSVGEVSTLWIKRVKNKKPPRTLRSRSGLPTLRVHVWENTHRERERERERGRRDEEERKKICSPV